MLDIGGWELLVIAVVALIVVGPKDLPGLVRNVGRWVAKARGMAREFQAGMEAAAKEADIDEFRQVGSLRKEIERKAREIGRYGDEVAEEVSSAAREPAAPPAKAKPKPGERVEPGFDETRARAPETPRAPENRWERPREERYPQREPEPGFPDDDDAPLDLSLDRDRYQTGGRRRD